MAALGGVALFVASCRRSAHPLEVGDPAPDFTVPALARESGDPATIRLSDYRGRVVVLNFWATWCPPCVEETPSLEKFSIEARRLGVAVIGVSVNQDLPALEKFVTDYRLSFSIARDPNQRLAWRFGTFQYPETYVIDRGGKVAEKIIGPFDWGDPRMLSFVEGLAHPEKPR